MSLPIVYCVFLERDETTAVVRAAPVWVAHPGLLPRLISTFAHRNKTTLQTSLNVFVFCPLSITVNRDRTISAMHPARDKTFLR